MPELPVSQGELKLTYLITLESGHDKLDKFMIALSNPYRWIIPVLTFALVLIYLDWKSGILAILLGSTSASLADAVNSRLIKKNAGRIRPGKMFADIRLLGAMNHGKKSFPSNHASNTMAFALAFTFIFSWAAWILIPFSLLVGYSRIYCGAHYPLDVIAGWIIGATWSTILYSILAFTL